MEEYSKSVLLPQRIIVTLEHPQAQHAQRRLAFLSACKTSVGEEKLPDEAVHLAAGMLAAGYRRVIATMWSINDKHATKVAQSFYQYLWDHPTDALRDGGFDGTLSAYALHHATQELRWELGGDSDDSILAWAPFIHYGY
ncbi:hypothetical protein NMY22_g8630 [Coprinellus aureogranulatus]|nr:hypothetical protein NMY22_g8630 [Coprinellus aureogranulatus]